MQHLEGSELLMQYSRSTQCMYTAKMSMTGILIHFSRRDRVKNRLTLEILQDAKDGKYYVFANEGDIYTDAAGNEFSYVTVIDTQAAAVCPAAYPVSYSMQKSQTVLACTNQRCHSFWQFYLRLCLQAMVQPTPSDRAENFGDLT